METLNEFHLDKEDDSGRWLLSYRLSGDVAVLRLRIDVGGRADWHTFTAEVQTGNQRPIALGAFEIAPIEIVSPHLRREWGASSEPVGPWAPHDEPQFQRLPEAYRETIANMVWQWGRLLELVLPVPTVPVTIH